MDNLQEVKLGGVQETLLIPLRSKAVETHQANPILRDTKAVELMKAIDYDFDKFAKGTASQVGCCLRAHKFDQWVGDFLTRHPQGTIVEIGVGLDARFERVASDESQWFELDLPDVIELRSRLFQQTDRRHFIAQSVLTPDWIEEVKKNGTEPIMFLAEGVFMYFEEEQIKSLFAMLADHFPGATLAFDSMSPQMVRMQNRHDTISKMSASFRWGVSDIKEVEAWEPRCSIEESIFFYDLAKPHIQRFPFMMRVMWLWPSMKRNYRLHLAKFVSASGEKQ